MRKKVSISLCTTALISIAFLISGCSAVTSSSATTSSQGTASVTQSSAADSSTPSSTASQKQLTAKEIADRLKSSGLPIENIIVYTEDTDTNKLLGRPNQYISKVNFADTTVEQGSDKSNPVGGSIETFNNADDLNTRKKYCESISKSSPMFAQYYYVNGNYLLRIDNDVTPTNAKKYAKAFAEIK